MLVYTRTETEVMHHALSSLMPLDIRLNSSFTITNDEGATNITISVATPPDQVTKITLYTDYVLTPGQSLEIKPTVVCRYLVTIKKGGETALEYFTYIDDITEYFIKDSLEFLCGDGCEDCKEKINKDCKQEKCDPHYSLFNQVIFLYKWYHSTIATIDILNVITSLYYVEILDNLCTETFKSKILGEDCCVNTFLFKKIIFFDILEKNYFFFERKDFYFFLKRKDFYFFYLRILLF